MSAAVHRFSTVSAVAIAIALAGCSSGEDQLSAEAAVAALNQAGAELELGESLGSGVAGIDLYVVRFSGGSGPLQGDAHGSGAVAVLEDEEAALSEFERCDSAVSFVCFRAANTVFRFDSISAEEQARITASMRSLAAGG